MEEQWKDIEGYEGYYKVSNTGKIFSIRRNKLMSLSFDTGGYLKVTLKVNCKNKTHTVHRIVANAFIPNTDNLPEINHKDEDKTNNNVDNLEWCTHVYNMDYGTYWDNQKKVHHHNDIHMMAIDKDIIIATYPSIREAARITGIHNGNISKACRGLRNIAGGYRWRYA